MPANDRQTDSAREASSSPSRSHSSSSFPPQGPGRPSRRARSRYQRARLSSQMTSFCQKSLTGRYVYYSHSIVQLCKKSHKNFQIFQHVALLSYVNVRFCLQVSRNQVLKVSLQIAASASAPAASSVASGGEGAKSRDVHMYTRRESSHFLQIL